MGGSRRSGWPPGPRHPREVCAASWVTTDGLAWERTWLLDEATGDEATGEVAAIAHAGRTVVAVGRTMAAGGGRGVGTVWLGTVER